MDYYHQTPDRQQSYFNSFDKFELVSRPFNLFLCNDVVSSWVGAENNIFLLQTARDRLSILITEKGIGEIPLANSSAVPIVSGLSKSALRTYTKMWWDNAKMWKRDWKNDPISFQLVQIMKYFNNIVIFHHLPLWDVIYFTVLLTGIPKTFLGTLELVFCNTCVVVYTFVAVSSPDKVFLFIFTI